MEEIKKSLLHPAKYPRSVSGFTVHNIYTLHIILALCSAYFSIFCIVFIPFLLLFFSGVRSVEKYLSRKRCQWVAWQSSSR